MIRTQNRAIQFGKKEIVGVDYNRLLLHSLKKGRDLLGVIYTNQNTLENQKLVPILKEMEDITKTLDALDAQYGSELDTADLYSVYKEEFRKINTSISNQKTNELNIPILNFLNKTLELNSHVGDTSNLILDPDLDSYYLMDISLIKIPALFAVSNEIEKLIHNTYQTKTFTEADRLQLFTLHSEYQSILKQIENSYQVAFKYNPKLKLILESKKNQALVLFNQYKESVYSFSSSMSSGLEVAKSEKILNSLMDYNKVLFDLYEDTVDAEKKLLEKRVTHFQIEQYTSLILVLLVVCFTVFIQYMIVISITNPLLEAVSKFELLSKGNLNNKIDYYGKDEIGILSTSINHFIEYLTNLIQSLTKLTNESNLIFAEISKMTSDLTLSTENQASSSEESAAALEEISSNFTQIASLIEKETGDIAEIGSITDEISSSTKKASESIHNLGIIIESSAKEVKKGETVIRETVYSMNQIKSAADEISKIIVLITEISKQIGLLALNASIEAARAGENGRGFSVVADEISKLSLKTEESVKHIRSLISSTNSSIKDGIHNVGTVVDVLKIVIERINETNKNAKLVDEEISSQSTNINVISSSHTKLESLSSGIDQSTKEERLAIRQVTESINRIASETQMISENTAKLREAAIKIASISTEVTKTVSVFQV
ncbi:MAG TPA: methyl-accepting chemotaxis protein [Leptospiraceae bacterium]|nr:methyl-accepting chemotaxis protein [Leptospiraceae bacterium]HNM90259.1 methyl-accepting chemotaxis protein [Leptospiraceae bacterium]